MVSECRIPIKNQDHLNRTKENMSLYGRFGINSIKYIIDVLK